MSGEDRIWVERVYRCLQRLYPRGERAEWGRDMLETYRRRTREAAALSPGARAAFHLREWAGVAVAGIAARVTKGGSARGPGPGRPPSGERAGLRERVESAIRHVRHGARRLVRSPGFTCAAVGTLALGIGANVAIYGVVDSVVLNPLPFPGADALVQLDNAAPGIGATDGLGFTPGMAYHVLDHQRTLEAAGAFDSDRATLTCGEGVPERVRFTKVTPSLVEVLKVAPLHGRWFLRGEGGEDRPEVAVLSHALWERRYGGDLDVIGRTIRIDRRPVRVVGIMPPSFRFPDADVRLWRPLRIDASVGFGGFWYEMIGRTRPGISPAEVRADLRHLYGSLTESFPGEAGLIRAHLEDARVAPLVTPLKAAILGNVARTLWILLGTVGFVLLIAWANVANLFLVRAESRQRETAVRKALGAGRRELAWESLSESLVLAGVAGTIGVGLAYAGTGLLVRRGPASLPRLHEVGVDASVLVFALGVTVVTALAFAAIPLLRRSRSVSRALRTDGWGATADRLRVRGRNLLVAGQTALALVLLVGSGLMVRSFAHLHAVDPGFEASPDILTFEIGLPRVEYPDDARAAAFHQELVTRLEGLPGVERAGVVTCLPLQGWCSGDPLHVEGRPIPKGTIPPIVAVRRAGPGYFRAMGIDLRSGRTFDRADHEQGYRAVVVSRELAGRYFPDEDPVGQRVAAAGDTTWSTIVGVVEDVPARSLMEGGDPLIYFPLSGPGFDGVSSRAAAAAVRAPDAAGLLPAIRVQLKALDPDVALARVRTTGRIVADAGARLAFTMVLLVLAAGVALLLGAVGIYGVISYLVTRRRPEIGVRMALGAGAAEVRCVVVRQGGLAAGAGLLVGLGAAALLTRFMDALLFGVEPTDPATFIAVSAFLLTVALLASWLPARRAARVDPAEALRAE